MIMTALFGGVFGGTSIVWDRRLGFLNKMLSAPIHRAAIPFGKLLSLGSQAMLQALIIVDHCAVAWAFILLQECPVIICLLLLSGLFGMIMGGISLSLARSHEIHRIALCHHQFPDHAAHVHQQRHVPYKRHARLATSDCKQQPSNLCDKHHADNCHQRMDMGWLVLAGRDNIVAQC